MTNLRKTHPFRFYLVVLGALCAVSLVGAAMTGQSVLDEAAMWAIAIIAAVAVGGAHESGHFLAAKAVGCKPRFVRSPRGNPAVRIDEDLDDVQIVYVCAAGPLGGALATVLLGAIVLVVAPVLPVSVGLAGAVAVAAIGAANMANGIPVAMLDGDQALQALRRLRAAAHAA